MATGTATAATNRRDYHQRRIADAAGFRSRLWRAAGWVVAEGRRRPDMEMDAVVDEIVTIAKRLNGRNADDDE
jgi:hypothetical protein